MPQFVFIQQNRMCNIQTMHPESELAELRIIHTLENRQNVSCPVLTLTLPGPSAGVGGSLTVTVV